MKKKMKKWTLEKLARKLVEAKECGNLRNIIKLDDFCVCGGICPGHHSTIGGLCKIRMFASTLPDAQCPLEYYWAKDYLEKIKKINYLEKLK